MTEHELVKLRNSTDIEKLFNFLWANNDNYLKLDAFRSLYCDLILFVMKYSKWYFLMALMADFHKGNEYVLLTCNTDMVKIMNEISEHVDIRDTEHEINLIKLYKKWK